MFVVERNRNGYSGQNTYKCRGCGIQISGSKQKIRVHITGVHEGDCRSIKCTRPPEGAVEKCNELREKWSKKRKQLQSPTDETGGGEKKPESPALKLLRQHGKPNTDKSIMLFLADRMLT